MTIKSQPERKSIHVKTNNYSLIWEPWKVKEKDIHLKVSTTFIVKSLGKDLNLKHLCKKLKIKDILKTTRNHYQLSYLSYCLQSINR